MIGRLRRACRLVLHLASLLVAGVALSGCVSEGAVAPASVDAVGDAAAKSRVVVADIDTGINPYHVEFRDDSPEGYAHPSTYLDGYPADTPALNLTLDAADYETAVLADCEVWLSVEPNTLYWIPGTRIVGAMTNAPSPTQCNEDRLPGAILDRGGHGTMTASRIAGATYSLCPECKIVFLQGFSSDHMKWASDQPYIDVQTNSWGALPSDHVLDRAGVGAYDRADVVAAAAAHAVFVAGGNGLLGFFGVTGHPHTPTTSRALMESSWWATTMAADSRRGR